MSLVVTSITLSVPDSHSEYDKVLKLLSGLLESWWSIVLTVSGFVPLSEQDWPVIWLTWLELLFVLWTYLSGLYELF